MDTPNFAQKQFLSSSSLNANAAQVTASVVQAISAMFSGSGIANKNAASVATAGLVATFTFGSDFLIVFNSSYSTGISGPYGTTPNVSNNVYTVNLASLVPSSGSQTVYIYATYYSLGMNPAAVPGPPISNPNYDPNFAQTIQNTYNRDSFSLSAGTSVPAGSFEIARTTLVAGQTGSLVLDTTHIQQVSAFQCLGIGMNGAGPNATGSETLTALNFGQVIFYTGTAAGTITLPLSASGSAYQGKIVVANLSSYACTIAPQGSDTTDLSPAILQKGQSVCVVNDGSSEWHALWNTSGSVGPFVVGNAVSNNEALALGQLAALVTGYINAQVPALVTSGINSQVPALVTSGINSQVPALVTSGINSQVPALISAEVPGIVESLFSYSVSYSSVDPYNTGVYVGPPAGNSGGLKLILQTGYWTLTGTGGIFSFPQGFPNGFLGIILTDQNGGSYNVIGKPVIFAANPYGSGGYVSQYAIQIDCVYWSGSAFSAVPGSQVASCEFIAIGY